MQVVTKETMQNIRAVESRINEFGLKNKQHLHLPRKLWHMTGITSMFAIFFFCPLSLTYSLLFASTLSIVPLDFLRQKFLPLNLLIHKCFKYVMRASESNSLTGMSYLLVGTSILILFFSKEVAGLSLLFLAFADPIASFCGVKYGSSNIFQTNKTLEGCFGAFITCFVISIFYYFSLNLMLDRLFLVAILSGLIGAFSEAIPIGKLDDNFTFPLISALLLSGLFKIFGGY